MIIDTVSDLSFWTFFDISSFAEERWLMNISTIVADGLRIAPNLVRPALAVAAFMVLVATGVSSFSTPTTAFISLTIAAFAFVLMVAAAAWMRSSHTAIVAHVLLWFFTIFFMTICCTLFSAWAFGIPKTLPALVGGFAGVEAPPKQPQVTPASKGPVKTFSPLSPFIPRDLKRSLAAEVRRDPA